MHQLISIEYIFILYIDINIYKCTFQNDYFIVIALHADLFGTQNVCNVNSIDFIFQFISIRDDEFNIIMIFLSSLLR